MKVIKCDVFAIVRLNLITLYNYCLSRKSEGKKEKKSTSIFITIKLQLNHTKKKKKYFFDKRQIFIHQKKE